MSPALTVFELDVLTKADWLFNQSTPVWRQRYGSYGATFDPFPAYAHDMSVVRATATWVETALRPMWDVELYVANRECVDRSNGYSNLHESGHHDEANKWVKDDPTGLIVLTGKRVPPHPAVTRYLVAHEYGHNVEWMINQKLGAKHPHDEALVHDYATIRGLGDEHMHHGSGGRWHDSVHEIFACDFRILVCGIERDYWPHHGIPKPHEVEAVIAWWRDIESGWTAP